MINQVNNSSVNKNIFAPFQTNGSPYAITKPFTEQQKVEREQEKEKKSSRIGLKITGAVGIFALAVFTIAMAFSKKNRGKLQGLVKKIAEQAETLSKNKGHSKFAEFRLKALKVTNQILVNSKSIFNFGNLKDVLVKIVFKKVEPLRRFSDAATRAFRKISNNTARFAYKGTHLRFENMYEQFALINKKLPKEKVKELERRISNIKLKYDNAFGIEARNSRLEETVLSLQKIDKDFVERSWKHPIKFAKKDAYTTFLAEEIAYPAKSNQYKKVIKSKAKISLSEKDNYNDIKKLINKVDLLIDPTIKEPREIIKKLNDHLNSFKIKQDAESKSLVLQEMQKLQEYCSKVPQYSTISNDLTEIINISKTSKPGEIQEIMSLYKEDLSQEDYTKLERTVNRATSSLNRSVDIETDKLFDKIRDLELGGAPSDIVAILLSVGYVGYELAKVDNKDERISVALKYGIPVIGAVVTSLGFALGLVSGGKSLIFGIIFGLLINKAGEFVDKLRKKDNKTETVINGSAKLIGDIKDSLSSK